MGSAADAAALKSRGGRESKAQVEEEDGKQSRYMMTENENRSGVK